MKQQIQVASILDDAYYGLTIFNKNTLKFKKSDSVNYIKLVENTRNISVIDLRDYIIITDKFAYSLQSGEFLGERSNLNYPPWKYNEVHLIFKDGQKINYNLVPNKNQAIDGIHIEFNNGWLMVQRK